MAESNYKNRCERERERTTTKNQIGGWGATSNGCFKSLFKGYCVGYKIDIIGFLIDKEYLLFRIAILRKEYTTK